MAFRHRPNGNMNVYQNDQGKLVLEFGSQREIDAMWLLTSHIGGPHNTLRSVFSNAANPSKGLYELLKPYVTGPCAEHGVRHPLARPRSTSELLDMHQENIEGSITFSKQLAVPTLAAIQDPNFVQESKS